MRIMLIGHSCSGKDTFAQILPVVTGVPWTNLSFSKDLSEVCKLYESSPSLAMMKLEHLSPFIKIEEKDFLAFKRFVNKKDKHRTALKVELGTWARMQDKDIWVRSLIQYVSNHPTENMVVTDVRLENEFVSLLQRGFIPIFLHADDNIRRERRKERDGVDELPDGKSEEEIDFLGTQCEFQIDNSFNETYLKIKIPLIVQSIKSKVGDKHRLISRSRSKEWL